MRLPTCHLLEGGQVLHGRPRQRRRLREPCRHLPLLLSTHPAAAAAAASRSRSSRCRARPCSAAGAAAAAAAAARERTAAAVAAAIGGLGLQQGDARGVRA